MNDRRGKGGKPSKHTGNPSPKDGKSPKPAGVAQAALAERVRRALSTHRHVEEKRLFGGLGFLHRGNLLAALWMDRLIVRVGTEQADKSLGRTGVAVFDPSGNRPMKGWLMVEPHIVEKEEELSRCLDLALAFVLTLPAKPDTEESMEDWIARSLKFVSKVPQES